jgi:hypothetical protein
MIADIGLAAGDAGGSAPADDKRKGMDWYYNGLQQA